MIIKAKSPEGVKTKVYDKDGKRIDLPIFEYNTETKEAKFYEKKTDKSGNVRYSVVNHKLVELSEILDGSYAEIDGVRV